jgi:predicted component of type VI protein secretion system
VTVLGGVLIAWLRQRRSDVRLTVSRDGDRSSVELTVKRVANVDAEGVQRQIAELNRLLLAEDGQEDK